jgi:hypothetical protein
MATLTPGRPVTLPTPELLVENQLAAGTHRFRLVVIDDSGLESDPADLVVTVRRRPTGPIGRPGIIDRLDVVDGPAPLRPIRRPQ